MKEEEAHRLAKLCGMLGSDHDGERASAAHLATKLLKSHDLTWHDVISKAFLVPYGDRRDRRGGDSRSPHWSTEPRTEAEWCHAIREHCWAFLNSWEQDFLSSVIKRSRWPLSEKQRAILDKLRDRYARAYA